MWASAPEPLIVEAPISDEHYGYALVQITLHGKPATLGIDLGWDEGTLMLSTNALAKLGVTLTDTTTLDSLTLGPIVETERGIRMFVVPFLRRAALVLPTLSLFSSSAPSLSPAASPPPEPLVAEAPIWGKNDARDGYAFLPITIHGKAATLLIDLQYEGTPLVSPAALMRLGVTLADTTQLDSLTLGSLVERHLPLKLDRRPSPDWAIPGPPHLPPVVGVVGVPFINHYDVLYDFPARRVRLYRGPQQPVEARAGWLPPEIQSAGCGRMVRIPPGAGTFTGVEMQLDGHPVTGVLEILSTPEKMNSAALAALGLAESSERIAQIPGIMKLVRGVHMTVGHHMFHTGMVAIWPKLQVESVLKPQTPVMLMSISTIREVVLYNSVSSGQVCVSTPAAPAR